MAHALERWGRAVIRYRWLTLVLVLGLTLGLAAAIGRLRVELDPDRQLPQEHPFIQALNEAHRIFHDKNLVIVALFPRDGGVFTSAFLGKLAEITDGIRRLPGASPSMVHSLAAPQVKYVRGTPEGMEVEPVLSMPEDLAHPDAVRRRALGTDSYVGTLVSRDGTVAAVHANYDLTKELPGYRQIHRAVLEVVERSADGTFEYRLAGPVVFLSHLTAYAARIGYVFPLALLVIGLVHYHAFRTFQGLFLPLVTGILSVVWSLGLMGLAGVPFDPYNVATPILILAVAAGHAVQMLKRFYEEFDRTGQVDEAVVASLVRVGPVLIAAGLVASLSFCSLALFKMATIRAFGLLSGFGILSALVIELTFIPAARALLPAPRRRERDREAADHAWFDRILSTSAKLATRNARGVVATAAGLALVAAALATLVRIDTSYKRAFGASTTVRRDDATINQHLAGTNTLVLLVDGRTPGTMEEPSIMRAIDALERKVEGEPGVGKAVSYTDFVRTMHAALTADDGEAGRLPATRKLAAQYFFLHSLSGGGEEDLDSYIDSTHRIARVRILVHEDSTRYATHIISVVRQLVAETFPEGYDVRYTGSLAAAAAATEVMVEGKLKNIAQVGLITFVLSSLLLRSFVGGLMVVTPLVLTVLLNFAVMAVLGIPLDISTSTIAALLIGIGADYAMYLLFRIREELESTEDMRLAIERALASAGKAVLFVSTAVAIGYATLGLTGYRPHLQAALLVVIATIGSSLTTLILVPAMVTYLRPAFLESRRGRPTLPGRERVAAGA